MKLNKQAVEIAMADGDFSTQGLADKMGVTRQYVWLYMGGQPCRPKTVKRFADALGVTAGDIVELEPKVADAE